MQMYQHVNGFTTVNVCCSEVLPKIVTVQSLPPQKKLCSFYIVSLKNLAARWPTYEHRNNNAYLLQLYFQELSEIISQEPDIFPTGTQNGEETPCSGMGFQLQHSKMQLLNYEKKLIIQRNWILPWLRPTSPIHWDFELLNVRPFW